MPDPQGSIATCSKAEAKMSRTDMLFSSFRAGCFPFAFFNFSWAALSHVQHSGFGEEVMAPCLGQADSTCFGECPSRSMSCIRLPSSGCCCVSSLGCPCFVTIMALFIMFLLLKQNSAFSVSHCFDQGNHDSIFVCDVLL